MTQRLSAAMGTRRGAAAADRLCEACVDLLAVDAAAISLILDAANAGTLGVSSSAARVYDEVQFTLGQGPCLTSVANRAPVLVSDLRDSDQARWPQYTTAMLEMEVHGVYAIPVLLAGEYVGALDLFRHRPGPLSPELLAGAIAAAQLAELPLLDLLADDLADDLAGNRADDSADDWPQHTGTDPDRFAGQQLNDLGRIEVYQATGMLVGQLDIDPAEALVRLRAHAYATGTSSTAVARDILDLQLRLEP